MAVQARRAKKALWGRMARHYQRGLLSRVLTSWAREFLPLAAEERARWVFFFTEHARRERENSLPCKRKKGCD